MPRSKRSYSQSSGSGPGSASRRPPVERQISTGSIRLRSGSTGHKMLKNEEEDTEHEPIEFSAKPQIVVDPRDIRITETAPGGETREANEGEVNIFPGEGEGDEFVDDERGGWGNKLDFLFSCISVSVGLGSKLLKTLVLLWIPTSNPLVPSTFIADLISLLLYS